MKVKFFDLKITNKKIKKNLIKKFSLFLDKGNFFIGPEVVKLEKLIAKKNNSKYCVCLSSGSSALYLALKSAGIKRGDEVITTPLSWIITSNAILECGAKPVFVDIDNSMNLNAELIEKKITKKTSAILTMHYAGLMCDMDKVNKIAKKYNLKVIEDAAQSFGAMLNGKYSGNHSDIASFSLNPMKPLSGFGEAGFVVTSSKKIFSKVLRLRHAGTIPDKKKINMNLCYETSLNHKMDNLNATLIIESLKNFNSKSNKIERLWKIYEKNLPKKIMLQEKKRNKKHARYVFPILAKNRDKLKNYLDKKNIETKIFNKPLIPDAPFYKKIFKKGNLPNAEKLIKKNLILPCHEKMTEKQVFYVINHIKKFYEIIN